MNCWRRSPGEQYRHGAAQAVLLSVRQLGSGKRSRVERGLLDLLAVLSPAGVPRRWLHRLPGHAELTGQITDDPVARAEQAIALLADASLITVSLDGALVGMHRLIQRVLRDTARKNGRLEEVLSAAANLIMECGPFCTRRA